MEHLSYVGSGPYCYANCLAMMFGARSPSPSVIELATCSSFGMYLLGGQTPFFSPYGWMPAAGIEHALAVLGWTAREERGRDEYDARQRLQAALADGPVFVGPVDIGLLRHQPGMTGAIGSDHYVVVLGIEHGQVVMHDPHGHPYATLPLADFMAAWRGELLGYGEPYTIRSAFRRVAEVSDEEAIDASIPAAIRWLSMEGAHAVPSGSLGNAGAAEALAARLDSGIDPALRGHLTWFAVRVGARRAADAATCLARIGLHYAARIASGQARLVGALQHPLVAGDDAAAAQTLRDLAPTWEQLLNALRTTPTGDRPTR